MLKKYNVDEINVRILNGDGTNWIKLTYQDRDIHFRLEPFHIRQAILRKVKNKKNQRELIKLFKKGKIDEGLDKITHMMIASNQDEKEFNKLIELYDYLVRNRDGLILYKLRENIKS